MPAVSLTPEVRVLRKAARLIRARGWTQGQSETKRGEVCAYRAIVLAANFDARAIARAASLLAERVGTRELAKGWNDIKGQTAANVIAVLEARA